jgi:hypothetical protein
MEKLTSTQFFRMVRESAQNGIELDAQEIKREYDNFAGILFAEDDPVGGKDQYRNELVYTRTELLGLTGVSWVWVYSASGQGHRPCR